jgi:hypothetical protein
MYYINCELQDIEECINFRKVLWFDLLLPEDGHIRALVPRRTLEQKRDWDSCMSSYCLIVREEIERLALGTPRGMEGAFFVYATLMGQRRTYER